MNSGVTKYLLLFGASCLLGGSLSAQGRPPAEVGTDLSAVEQLDRSGAAALRRGDLEEAATYSRRALEVYEKTTPKSLDMVRALSRVAAAAHMSGDLALADGLTHRALVLCEELRPESLLHASVLSSLGNLALARGDLDGAERRYRSALELHERLAEGDGGTAKTLSNLAIVASMRDDLARAEEFLRRALTLQRKAGEQPLAVAVSLFNLGTVAKKRGDLTRAEDYYRQVLAIHERMAPDSIRLAASFDGLGEVAQERGDLTLAEGYYRRALAIRRRLAPGSAGEVRTLHALATVLRDQGREELAAEVFDRALGALDSQIRRLGGSSGARRGFRARHHELYQDHLEVLLSLERPAEAFHVAERSRARSFLEMLAQRDLLFGEDLPEELKRARSELGSAQDGVLKQLASLDGGESAPEIERLSLRLETLAREREEVERKIRQASSRLEALRYPRPLTLGEARDTMDPGTTQVSYSVGEKTTHVFVVSKEAGLLRVATVPVGEEQLRHEVGEFRRAILRGRTGQSTAHTHLLFSGRYLYRLLLEPVADTLESSRRIQVVPDGPLHLLPFGALIRETGEYVVEWKPLHHVLSATLYGWLLESRPGPEEEENPRVALFGDPRYPGRIGSVQADLSGQRSAADRGLFEWNPLPYSRREVEGIATLYPSERVEVFLGEDATEERVKALGPAARIVHLAVHSHLDDRHPMNSGLALTVPAGLPEDRDNGLLQAWEIFESVRLEADLVVLSACATALGKEQTGEGLMGLTRAFQLAGARSVAASLWSVDDLATSELMVRFYRHLRAGKSKDEALRAAQVELIRGPAGIVTSSGESRELDASMPYYWAAFQIIGDWR